MKIALTILAVLICACSAPASEKGRDNLSISVVLATGERSKDSSSQTTMIAVEGDTIVWSQESSGGHRTTTAPVRKEFKLSPADKQNLIKLIRTNNLLRTDSIVIPRDAPGFYFSVSADLILNERKAAINISAPRNADEQIKEEKLYQNTLSLVTELYRIMRSQDKSVRVCATFFC